MPLKLDITDTERMQRRKQATKERLPDPSVQYTKINTLILQVVLLLIAQHFIVNRMLKF